MDASEKLRDLKTTFEDAFDDLSAAVNAREESHTEKDKTIAELRKTIEDAGDVEELEAASKWLLDELLRLEKLNGPFQGHLKLAMDRLQKQL